MTAIEKIDPVCQDSSAVCLLPWLENPYRLVSLKELSMEHGYRIYGLLTTLQIFESLGPEVLSDKTAALRQHVASKSVHTMFERPEFRNLFGECGQICADLNLQVSYKQLDRLAKLVQFTNQLSFAEFAAQIKNITMVVSDELETCCFVWVAPAKKQFYECGADPFDTSVSSAFPSAAYDISEASKCYALGRNTACVLHLMRVLENGLSVFAKHLGVEFRHENWNGVIDRIDSEIASLIKAPKRTPEQKDEHEYYAQCSSYLRSVKDAWRNYTMHRRGKYDEQEAFDKINEVRGFMQRLATKLTEHGAVTP